MGAEEGKKWDHLVADAAEHVKAREDALASVEPPREKRSRVPVLIILLVILGGVGVHNFLYFTSYERAALEQEDSYLRSSIYLTALILNAAEAESGAFPSTLEAIGMDDEAITYVPSDRGYVLMAEGGAVSLEYTSGTDLAPFRSAFQSLLPEEVVR